MRGFATQRSESVELLGIEVTATPPDAFGTGLIAAFWIVVDGLIDGAATEAIHLDVHDIARDVSHRTSNLQPVLDVNAPRFLAALRIR
jgi:hypothetical protein